MILLDRHIRNAVLLSMLVVIGLISTLDFIFSLLDQIADTDENYTTLSAVNFVLFTMPTSIYELLPFAALGGALIGLGVLASNNELIVMQSAGVRVSRIVAAVLKPTFFVMLISLLLGEYVSPPLQQIAQSNRAIKQSASVSINPERGTWQRVGNEFIHINAIAPGGRQLFGIIRYQVDENRRLLSASFTESAKYVELQNSAYWLLNNVKESIFSVGAIETQSYHQKDWQVELSPELLSVLLVEPDEQSISGLYRFAQYFEAEGLDSDPYYLAFWKKLLQPLATLALVVLAISFVFGPLREATMGARVFVALGIGLVFMILQRVMEPASLLYGFNPLLAVLFPIILCTAFGLFFLHKVR